MLPSMAGWLFLAASLWGAAFTVAALVRARHLHALTFFYFLAGWLTSELALHHVAWQLLVTVGFVLAGALETLPGRIGLGVTLCSWVGLWVAHRRAAPVAEAARRALAELAVEPEPAEVGASGLANPFRMGRPGVERIRGVAYGEPLEGDRGRRNELDVIRPREPGEGRPVLLQVHGGGWVYGEKEHQAAPLMTHMAERGWVCVAQNYRLAPRAPFPAQIVDVKRAIAWIRENAPAFGGDPDFVCITGGSAGGHLSSLAALTANEPAFQPGFEDVDTTLAAAVPFYGVYDFLNSAGLRGPSEMTPFLERWVMKSSPVEDRAGWESASPLFRIHDEAPPFLVIHGTHDSLAFVEEAQLFALRLREKSRSPVLYLEAPGAQHAFDTFHSVRSRHVTSAVAAFLAHVHASR